ncbi:MAG: hypothetical protein EON54_27480 [Alcaligenaceae bacterium]|nr:MAG: hypothetical protein EON54_27480 [Alcaligenaceae bacterium]
MGEWSDYFEQFPDENPANEPRNPALEALRARVAREARYVEPVNAEGERRAAREALRASLSRPNKSSST